MKNNYFKKLFIKFSKWLKKNKSNKQIQVAGDNSICIQTSSAAYIYPKPVNKSTNKQNKTKESVVEILDTVMDVFDGVDR